MVYDYRQGILQYAVTQVSYNSDCCGLSVQWRRFSFGTRNENQYLVSFAVAAAAHCRDPAVRQPAQAPKQE